MHRIGRTGRAGRDSVAVSFCCIDEMKELRQIEKLTGKTLRRLESEWPMQVFEETLRQPCPPRPGREAAPATEKTARKQPVKAAQKPEDKKPKAEKPAPQPPKKPRTAPDRRQPAASVPGRATPLERPVSASAVRRQEQPPLAIQRQPAEKPAFTYADLLKERRKAPRRPLSTGNDRF